MRLEYRENMLAVQDSFYPLIVLAFTVLTDVFLTVIIILFNSHLWTNIFAGLTFVTTIALYNIFHVKLGLFCSSTGLIISMLEAYIAAYFIKYLLRSSNKKLINMILGAYFSRSTRRKIVSSVVACEPTSKQVTILECAISCPEQYIQEAQPKNLFSNINYILDIVISTIIKNGGRVDKFIGTKVYAYWENQKDAYLAAKSAIEIFKILNSETQNDKIKTRIAIHFQEVLLGILGTTKVINYSIISNALEITDEIIKAADMYNKKILMSKAVYKECWRDISAIKVATLNLRGDAISTELYEPIDLKNRPRLTNIFEIEKND